MERGQRRSPAKLFLPNVAVGCVTGTAAATEVSTQTTDVFTAAATTAGAAARMVCLLSNAGQQHVARYGFSPP